MVLEPVMHRSADILPADWKQCETMCCGLEAPLEQQEASQGHNLIVATQASWANLYSGSLFQSTTVLKRKMRSKWSSGIEGEDFLFWECEDRRPTLSLASPSERQMLNYGHKQNRRAILCLLWLCSLLRLLGFTSTSQSDLVLGALTAWAVMVFLNA